MLFLKSDGSAKLGMYSISRAFLLASSFDLGLRFINYSPSAKPNNDIRERVLGAASMSMSKNRGKAEVKTQDGLVGVGGGVVESRNGVEVRILFMFSFLLFFLFP